jgi:hypothetical protein
MSWETRQRDGSGPRSTTARWLVFVAVVILASLVALWLAIPWEWSTVDDPGQVIVMRSEVAARGPILGAMHRTFELARGDRIGGIFRPGAWVYPSLIYQLPIAAAHIVRLLMVLATIVGPLVYFRRQGANLHRMIMTLLLLLAAGSRLDQGLFLLSIQELSGAAFVGLGLAVRNPGFRSMLWAIAALFKSPFSWLLLGNAVMLWRTKRRRLAMLNGVMGVLILGTSVWWSLGGTYSSGYSPDLLSLSMWRNAAHLADVEVILLFVAFAWWVLVTRTPLTLKADWVVFGIAWAGYTIQMIPWSLNAYYLGPIAYLLSLLLASLLTNPIPMPMWRSAIALVVPVLVVELLLLVPLRLGFQTNALIGDLRRCLTPLASTTAVLAGGSWGYVTTSPEGPIRIVDGIKLGTPGWRGSLSLERPDLSGFRDPRTSHYVTFNDVTVPEGRPTRVVCMSGQVTIHQLGPAESTVPQS